MKLNVLLDFYCDLGNASRLIKYLKDKGFSPRQLTFDSLRLRIVYDLKPGLTSEIVDKTNSIVELLAETNSLWHTSCIEVWIESSRGRKSRNPTVIRLGEVNVYTRPGIRDNTVYKIVWIETPGDRISGAIPESITRKCITSENVQRDLVVIQKTIEEFIKTLVTTSRD